jgi:hypothetical protein
MGNDVKARMIQVIEVEHIRGGGTENEPLRAVKTYWDMKGNLLAEQDPFQMASSALGRKAESVEVPL